MFIIYPFPKQHKSYFVKIAIHANAVRNCLVSRKSTGIRISNREKIVVRKEKRRFPTESGLAFRKTTKGEIYYEEQQSDQCSRSTRGYGQVQDAGSFEVGVNLKNGYNGDLTSREAGSVGGQMVKKMCPVRSMKYDRQSRTAVGHCQRVEYIATITI